MVDTGSAVKPASMEASAPAGFRSFHLVAMVFVTSLLIANTIAVKVIRVGPFAVPAGTVVFPISYIFGDVLTEVWGYRRARSIIWWGFACQAFMAGTYWLATVLPPAAFWDQQAAFVHLFGQVPRLVVASFIAYLVGELLNSAVLSRLKVATEGEHFWLRCVASTLAGQAADSAIFCVVAFGGLFSFQNVAMIAASSWLLKSVYEVLALPVTYVVVGRIKRVEGVDVYDRGISYNPLPSG